MAHFAIFRTFPHFSASLQLTSMTFKEDEIIRIHAFAAYEGEVLSFKFSVRALAV